MNDFISACFLVATASALILLIAGREKELASVISSLLFLLAFLHATLRLGMLIDSFLSSINIVGGAVHIDVLLKSVGVALLTTAASTLCEESGQRAAARAVDLLGAIETVFCAMPIINDFLALAEKTFLS